MGGKAKGMRRGLTRYGDEGFALYLRKAFIKALGYSESALERPVIGIADTASGYNPCHGTVPQIVEAVKRGVLLAGGLPVSFPTISLHESFAWPTSMYLRNLMAIDSEEMMRAQPMDAAVLIGGSTSPYKLNARSVRRVVALAEGRPDGGAVIFATSPRTPAAATRLLTEAAGGVGEMCPWLPGEDNPYPALLAEADRFIVTEDSVSMIAEAVETG